MLDMLGRNESVNVKTALKLLDNIDFELADNEKIRIENAYKRILSEDIIAPEDLPPFPRSTMDGYAVNASDTFGASENLPAYLKFKGEIFMGEKPEFSIEKDEVAKIPTGGILPDGANAVIMFEHIQVIDNALVEVMKAVSPGENVIQAGEDSRKGDKILKKGHFLRSQDIGVLAGLGIIEVLVFKKPVVSIISTGDEIVHPVEPLKPGQIRDINSYNLFGLIESAGGKPVKKGIFRDDYEAIKGVVNESIKNSHIVLITGGSSVGTRDMTAKIIDELSEIGVIFHGVSIKPGKPILAGVVNKKPVFGLPGHPVAVTISFEVFVKRVLKKISGFIENNNSEFLNMVRARVTKNISSAPGREDHIRVKLIKKDGEILAEPIFSKSGLISSLVKADGTIIISEDKRGVLEGEKVFVRLLI